MNRRFSFGILASVIALMGAMVFSACGHDDIYSESNVERMTNATYAAAFEKAFGKVGSNVDWGFSTKSKIRTRAVGDYASAKGAIAATVTFPTDCDAGNFLKDVPEGAIKLPADGRGPGSYYIDGTTTKVSTWAGASKIYVTETVDLSADDTDAEAPKFAPDYRSEIYLLEGATLKLGEQSALNFNVAAIYIASGAKLETAGLLKANNSTKVYNHGIVSAGTFEVNTNGFLYNVGTLSAGSVNAESNNSRIVNDGTINATDVVVNAGAAQNNAEWNVTGTTRINSNNSGWVNNGHWTTRNYAYIGGSENVINNCFLEVTNDFEMNISSVTGAFKMDSGCGVVTKNFYGGRDSSTGAISGPFKIVMGAASVFKVTETAVLESGRSSVGDTYEYGIFGPTTGGYAVFQAKNIVREASIANTWGAVTYGGNLYVSAETHFAQGNDGMAAHKYIFEQDGFSVDTNIYAAGFKPGKPSIKIKETACCPGFEGDDEPDPTYYRVIAEDLSAQEAGDFDFNDVVFDVIKAEGGRTTLKLICAGGVLPLRVRGASEPEGVEIHSVFGQSAPNAKGEYSMYNTGAGPTAPETEFTVVGEYTTPEQIKNIIIEVKKNDIWMSLNATRGEAACKILVDSSFKPVRERRNIADENQRFTDYVQGTFVDDFWWK